MWRRFLARPLAYTPSPIYTSYRGLCTPKQDDQVNNQPHTPPKQTPEQHEALIKQTAVIRRLGRQGRTTEAQRVATRLIEQGVTPDLPFYNAMMTVFASSKEYKRAKQLLQRIIDEGHTPNIRTFNTLISCQPDEPTECISILEQMKQFQVPPDAITLNTMLEYTAERRLFRLMLRIFAIFPSFQLRPDIFSFSTVVPALLSDKEYRTEGMKIYKYLVNHRANDLTPAFYNGCMTTRIKSRDLKDVLFFWDDMKRMNVSGNCVTAAVLFRCATDLNFYQIGQEAVQLLQSIPMEEQNRFPVVRKRRAAFLKMFPQGTQKE